MANRHCKKAKGKQALQKHIMANRHCKKHTKAGKLNKAQGRRMWRHATGEGGELQMS